MSFIGRLRLGVVHIIIMGKYYRIIIIPATVGSGALKEGAASSAGKELSSCAFAENGVQYDFILLNRLLLVLTWESSTIPGHIPLSHHQFHRVAFESSLVEDDCGLRLETRLDLSAKEFEELSSFSRFDLSCHVVQFLAAWRLNMSNDGSLSLNRDFNYLI